MKRSLQLVVLAAIATSTAAVIPSAGAAGPVDSTVPDVAALLREGVHRTRQITHDELAAAALANGSGTTTSESTTADWTYVALGDSWPEGAHCNGCQPFPELHAEAVQAETGRTVEFENLAGQAQPGFEDLGGGMASLLDAMRTSEAFRAEVASGDIIVIATGPNEGEAVMEAVSSGTCGGADNFECVRELGQSWGEDLDGILDEIEQLRPDQPTAVRLVNAANGFVGSALPGLDEETTAAFSELFFEELTVAMCENASAHGVECLDVRPILNGPNLDQPVDDSSVESMAAVADALTQVGVAELE